MQQGGSACAWQLESAAVGWHCRLRNWGGAGLKLGLRGGTREQQQMQGRRAPPRARRDLLGTKRQALSLQCNQECRPAWGQAGPSGLLPTSQPVGGALAAVQTCSQQQVPGLSSAAESTVVMSGSPPRGTPVASAVRG